jgi:heptosyltransferase-2
MDKEKILIIKTGYTEILDGDQNSKIVSLGDVLRTTPLLHKYKDRQITWITSEEARPLLRDNPYINRLLSFDLLTCLQLESEEFDKIINLEKVPGICALSDKIRARRSRYGFTFNTQTGKAEALDHAYEVLAVSFDSKYKKENKRTVQELLFEMVGETFNGEEYILGYKPKTKEIYELGFNTEVGSKWPSKAWPMENWDKLEELLKDDYSISRQEKQGDKIKKDLEEYMDWINSCKTLVTNDSLGLHIALALKKNVVALLGPTPSKELCLYNKIKILIPEGNLNCLPCFSPSCLNYKKSCMNRIYPETVSDEIKKGFK